MFCVVYQWKVKAGKEGQFRQSWREITEAIFRQNGSLGSRLHKSDCGSWVAYAQWPDRCHWESGAATIDVELARAQRDECLEEGVQVVFKLEVTDDLFKPEPFQKLAGL
jgi:quinol monooxygenase YgiN